MHWVRAIVISLVVCRATFAADDLIMPDEVVGSVQVWLNENVDDWVFDLADVDADTLDQTLAAVQDEIKESLPKDIEPNRQDAEHLLQVLNEFEITRSYAPQVRLFFDGFTSPTPPTNTVIQPPLRPTPLQTRATWLSVMARRPVPARAETYLEQIKPIFQSENIPAELVWIAEVESAFDPDARSPVGAVGLFQLMPETAKSLGLSTWFPDERCNPAKNAAAAAKYLKYLHNRFDDWQLTLAAYNAGPTRVARLLRASDAFSYEAIANRVPLETFDYVAKVEATLMVREGVELSAFDRPTETASD